MLESICSNYRKRRIYKLKALSNLVTMCYPFYTLRAIVNGQYKTIEWVLHSGSAVNWLTSPDQFNVNIEIPIQTISEDRIFRFYVNRGMKSEQFVEQLLTGIPTSTFTLKNISFNNDNKLTSSLQLTPIILSADRAPSLVNNKEFNIDFNYDNNDILLYWTASANAERYILFKQTNILDEWVEVPSTGRMYLNPDLNTFYKVALINKKEILFSNIVYTFSANEYYDVDNKDSFELSSGAKFKNLELPNTLQYTFYSVNRPVIITNESDSIFKISSIEPELSNTFVFTSYSINRPIIIHPSDLLDSTLIMKNMEINFNMNSFTGYTITRLSKFIIG